MTGIEGNQIAIAGILITSVASLVTQWLRTRSEDKRRVQEHEWDIQDRAASQASRAILTRDLAENTALTRVGNADAKQAYEVANNVNDKIAAIAKASLGELSAQAMIEALRRNIASDAREAAQAVEDCAAIRHEHPEACPFIAITRPKT
jgi:hypothetical protein